MNDLPRFIGVVHLPRLPSSHSRAPNSPNDIAEFALNEAKILEEAGFDGAILENYGDAPYLKIVNDPLTISTFAVAVREVVRGTGLKVGVNLLRNSGFEAYSIAVAGGASFIRVNALSETIISDSGIIEPEAARLRDLRSNYPAVKVMADVLVKHAGSMYYLALRYQGIDRKIDLEEVVKDVILDTVERGGADAVIVTGPRTGEPPEKDLLILIKKFSSVPVYVGSGTTPQNVNDLLENADGIIVGSYLKRDGRAGNPVEKRRAEEFMRAVRGSKK